jgi:hypothetical protein
LKNSVKSGGKKPELAMETSYLDQSSTYDGMLGKR